MGRVIDRTGIQFRLLNRSRGPAVQAPRAQADRTLYRVEMRRTLEATPNLSLRQGLVTDLLVKGDTIVGVELQDARRLAAKAVIVATGTFLNGKIHTGRRTYAAMAAPGMKTVISLGTSATIAMQTMPTTRPIALENSPAESAPITKSNPAAARAGRCWR